MSADSGVLFEGKIEDAIMKDLRTEPQMESGAEFERRYGAAVKSDAEASRDIYHASRAHARSLGKKLWDSIVSGLEKPKVMISSTPTNGLRFNATLLQYPDQKSEAARKCSEEIASVVVGVDMASSPDYTHVAIWKVGLGDSEMTPDSVIPLNPVPFITADDMAMQREFNRINQGVVRYLGVYRPVPPERVAEIYAKLEKWGA